MCGGWGGGGGSNSFKRSVIDFATLSCVCAGLITVDDKGQDPEDEKEDEPEGHLFDSMTVDNIQNQVTLF